MELAHFIAGKEHRESFFTVSASFKEYPLTLHLPHFTAQVLETLRQALETARAPPLEERRRLVQALLNFQPSAECLESICYLLGMPISWVQRCIEQGKKIAQTISALPSRTSHKKVAISLSPNDPRELFYFMAHALIAGSPTVIKLSSREPVFGLELIRHLHAHHLPPGLLNIVYADSSNPADSSLLQTVMDWVDLPIVMGSATISKKQLSFCAEHSRSLVLDAEAAIPHLQNSITSPLSCLAEKNYIVVGEENYRRFLQALVDAYKNLRPGQLLDPKTTLGLIQAEVLEDAATILKLGQITDTAKVLHPASERIDTLSVARGVVVEHYSEDHEMGVNPLLATSLPLYVTGVRLVGSLQEALRDLEVARDHIKQNYNIPKSMALSIYGSEPHLFKAEEYVRIHNLAFDIHHNKSPVQVDGLVHQGVNLNEVLTL